MSRKELSFLLTEYLQEFEKEYINTVNTDEKEAIHELRISIKRLRALLNLFEESRICTKKELKPFKRVKYIFGISGNLREHQIKTGLLEVYKEKLNQNFENFRKSILRQSGQAKEEYWNEMKNISFIEIFKSVEYLKEKIAKKSNDTINKNIKKFVDSRVEQSYNWLGRANFRDYLHEVRKYLKHIRFTTEQLEVTSSKLFKGKFKFKNIKKAEDMLGEWHDLDLFLIDVQEYKVRKTGYTVGVYDNLIEIIKADLLKMEIEMRPVLLELFEAYLKLIGKKTKINKAWVFPRIENHEELIKKENESIQ